MHSRLRNLIVSGIWVGVLAMGDAHAQWGGPPPAAPAGLTALPDYGTNRITLRWTDVADERGYRVYRRTGAGGAWGQIGRDLVANTTSYVDVGPFAAGTQYFYKVRAFRIWESADSNIVQQNLIIAWTVPTSHEILHTWNDTIGTAGTRGFHEGVDIQQTMAGPRDEVVAARGGTVVSIAGGVLHNEYVFIRVTINGRFEYDCYLHLETAVAVAVNDVVFAGQRLGQMGTGYFPVVWTDHMHFFIAAAAAPLPNPGIRHPQAMYTAANDRDPGGTAPEMFDHPGAPAGDSHFRHQGDAAGTRIDYDRALRPLDRDIDILVGMRDEQGTDPDQAPMKLWYWIVGPRPAVHGVDHDNVKNGARAYQLMDFTGRFWGGQARSEHVVDSDAAWNHGPRIMVGGVAYPWPQHKHFIVTNAGAMDGAATNVSDDQFWNTNAKNDRSDPLGDHANFATEPDTTMAHEARFPDGEYEINIYSADLDNENWETIDNVRIENYPPILKSVVVYYDFDGDENTPAAGENKGYERKVYEFNHLNPDAYKVTPDDIKSYRIRRADYGPDGTAFWIKLTFSETIDKTWADENVQLDIKNDGGGPYGSTRTWSRLYADDDTVVAEFSVAADEGEDEAMIIVKQRDRRDRLANHRCMDKDSNGVPEADCIDNNHIFLVCSDDDDANNNRVGDICEPTPTPTKTATPTKTHTPTPTWTPTWTYTPSPTYTATPTYTPTPTSTSTPTWTRTATRTNTPVPSTTASPLTTATAVITETPEPPTSTPTETPATETPTGTPATETPTGTPATETPTEAPATETPTATPEDSTTPGPSGTVTPIINPTLVETAISEVIGDRGSASVPAPSYGIAWFLIAVALAMQVVARRTRDRA